MIMHKEASNKNEMYKGLDSKAHKAQKAKRH